MDWSSGRSLGDVFWGLDAGGGFFGGCDGSGFACFARRCCGFGGGDLVGNDVYPLSEGLFDGDESAVVCDIFYVWGSGDDGGFGRQLYRDRGVVASACGRAGGSVLVDAGRICLGDWGFVSAVCGEVCGN